ncbi:unnamed protein product [Parascedosporium putredinis]|uniref:MATE efflux family protein n=1 Tax=Parascedosporium putredinis TaxID=1442378 RepID=A0A9P1M8W1_9PEZI|nr:unnamed protein product [Parascedosporium putredinis]CAI7993507.1 unnamed protein product [Parascedosporium putredinis]
MGQDTPRAVAGSVTTPPDEYTSLLTGQPQGSVYSQNEEDQITVLDEDKPTKKLILEEVKVLLKGSVPVVLAYTLQNSLQTVSVLIVGRSSPENLATAAFSYMFAMCTAWLIGLGGTTALDTLASSTFTGSSNKHDLGILLQRAFIVLGLFYIPVATLWAFSEPVFRSLGQDPQLSRDSARFLTCLIPGGLGYIYFEAMKKYLQAQGIARPGTYVLFITSPFSAALNYLFVYKLDMGLLGAPIATGIAYWLSFGLLLLYARFVAGSECWGGWTRQSLENMGLFARLASMGIIHVGTECVIMTADQVLNTIPFGLGVAASVRVGNLLGARDPKGAARAAHCAACLSVFLGLVVLVVLMATRNNFAKIFNDDEQVVRLTAEVLPYVALFQIADGLNGSCGGSLRGMGLQHIGAAVNLVSYYCGALPLGIYLAFHGWGLKGLWVGQCIALYLVGTLEWIIVGLSNWEREVEKAFLRMDKADQVEAGGLLH